MTNSRLLYASTRRCVGAQPWGVSPHPRRAQRDVGSRKPTRRIQLCWNVIYGQRGQPHFCAPRLAAPIGGLNSDGDWAGQGSGLEVERLAGRGAGCDDTERAFIPSSAFPPVCFCFAADLELAATVHALHCPRQNRPPTPLTASPGSESRPIRHHSLTARVMRLLGTSCLRIVRRPSWARSYR